MDQDVKNVSLFSDPLHLPSSTLAPLVTPTKDAFVIKNQVDTLKTC
jgi:hypothetical protein